MEIITAIEWNVKNMSGKACLSSVADEIEKIDADIVILTEYNIDANKGFKIEGYKLKHRNESSKKNETDILIAIKECDDIKIYDEVFFDDKNNFLIAKVDIDFNGEYMPVYIAGLRIRIKSGAIDEGEQKSRLKQLEEILDSIDSCDISSKNVLLMGDFNNYKTRGSINNIKN